MKIKEKKKIPTYQQLIRGYCPSI